MQLKKARFSDQIGKTIARVTHHTLYVPVISLLTFATAPITPAEAATVDIFLIAEQTPSERSTSGLFSITTKTAYRLSDLNSNSRARQATLVDNFTFNIGAALSYSSHENPDASLPTDPGEAGAGTASYVNSEIAAWDNLAGSTGAGNADEQIDFGRNSSVTFNPVSGGFTDLIIADLGGLNPFRLTLCGNAECSFFERIFSGFNSSVTNFLLSLDVFAASDSGIPSEMDQTWLFRFSDPILDFVRVTEFDNRNIFTGSRLQADFIGVGASTSPSPVPGPAGLPLLASGLGIMVCTLRRKRAGTRQS